MAIHPIVFQDFEGGWSTDLKVGIKNSQAYTQSFDFRTSPSQMSVLPKTTREDSDVVKDLIQNEVMTSDGTIFAMGSTGQFYKRTNAGVWSSEGSLSAGAFGMDYRQDLDSIYICGLKNVSMYNPVSNKPVLLPDYYSVGQTAYDNSANATFNVNCFQQNSQLATNILVAATPLDENQPNVRYFQTDIEPLNKIDVFVKTKGTGDWTLTLHDGLNNNLGSVTVTNANLTNDSWNDFVFATPVRVSVAPAARTYHIHVTSTVADGSVTSTATNDLSSCDLEIWADRMVSPINGMHPMINFQQFECIGNERYLSVWEPLGDVPPVQGSSASEINSFNSEWKRHGLIFPPFYQVCGLAVLNEYIAIACERIPTGNNTAQDGIIFWWDGLSSTYNYFTQIPEGSPYGIQSYQNAIYYIAGDALYAITAANGQPTKVRTLPGTQNDFSYMTTKTNVYPNTMTVRDNILLMGYPSSTTSLDIPYGVYSWGSVDKNYPQSFGYDYLISTGTQFNGGGSTQIGMVKNFGDLLHISWQDGAGNFGVDYVDNFSPPAPLAIWQSMIVDAGYVSKQKFGAYMEAYLSQLPSGSNLYLSYQIDRSGVWVTSPAYNSTTQFQGIPGYARWGISVDNDGRFYELQLQVTVTSDSTVTQPPTALMVSLVYDDAKEEQLV